VSYEILIEGKESIDGWSVCIVCLNVDRTAAVERKRWRCSDCGIDAGNNTQQPLRTYFANNTASALENNLRAWGSAKGVRAAYKMLKSARYKCLVTLSKREQA
jgi:hypothetical protein